MVLSQKLNMQMHIIRFLLVLYIYIYICVCLLLKNNQINNKHV